MNAFKSNIYSYLGGNCHYIIPIFQRTYSWRIGECKILWEDIVNLHLQNKQAHFIGSIVRIDESAPAGSTISMIIDGQQRLTTLTILLIALRDYVSINSECSINPDEIQNSYLINQYNPDNTKYKLFLTQSDKDVLIKKINKAHISSEVKSRILDNYEFFYNKIHAQEITAIELKSAIGKLQIVDIVLDRYYDDPQAIFESLNSTGMNLKYSDLIRNHLLMGLDSVTQTNVYNNIWRPIEMMFINNSELMDNFFRDYLTMKLGRIPRKSDIYKEFCSYHNSLEDITVDKLCNDVYEFAKYYSDMYFSKSNDKILKTLYEDMKTIKMDVAYPFLLKVHYDYTSSIIDIETLREITSLCVSYVMRRAICDIPPNSLNKTFATMKNVVNENDYLDSIKAFFLMLDSYKDFPNDKRFKENFIKKDIYKLSRCKFILLKLENFNNKSVVLSTNHTTIEHIMPQNPNLSDEWIATIGENFAGIQKQYLHTIGNLTLTSYNSELSDTSFENKMNTTGGFKESALRLNKYVVSQKTWGEVQIKERADLLANIALKQWPYPNLSTEKLEIYNKKVATIFEYTIDTYENFNDENKLLFDKLNAQILDLGSFVKRECKKHYIAYKADTNFVDVVVQKSKLRLSINMKFDSLIDPKNICNDVSCLGRWGNGDVEIMFDDICKIDDVMEIIEQGLRQQGI